MRYRINRRTGDRIVRHVGLSSHTPAVIQRIMDYLQKADSNSRSFQSCQEQAEVYRQLESTYGTDAVALYRAALKR